MELGIIKCLKKSLFLLNEKQIEKSIWILSNIILDKNKDIMNVIVREEGLIERLFDFCQNSQGDLKQNAIQCLSAICQFQNEETILVLIEKQIFSLFHSLLFADQNKRILLIVLESITSILHLFARD